MHGLDADQSAPVRLFRKLHRNLRRHVTSDFTQMTRRELSHAVTLAERVYRGEFTNVPVVFIGHSKLIADENLNELKRFFAWAGDRDVRFGTFNDIVQQGTNT